MLVSVFLNVDHDGVYFSLDRFGHTILRRIDFYSVMFPYWHT